LGVNKKIFENSVQSNFFSGIEFSDKREREVFLSYIRGFMIPFLDDSVKHIVEIGAGQSTAIFALMAERFSGRVTTIDMKPESISKKIRNDELCQRIFSNVNFQRGFSIGGADLKSYFNRSLETIGGVSFDSALSHAGNFIDSALDARKVPLVLKALNIGSLTVDTLKNSLLKEGKFAPNLLDVYRNERDEFSFEDVSDTTTGLLSKVMDDDVDMVFLDSGEYSSLPEWEIVSEKIRPGGYVVLHDVLFPKSFKNWLVCGSIIADPSWEAIYFDNSTPQGLLIAKKNI